MAITQKYKLTCNILNYKVELLKCKDHSTLNPMQAASYTLIQELPDILAPETLELIADLLNGLWDHCMLRLHETSSVIVFQKFLWLPQRICKYYMWSLYSTNLTESFYVIIY